MSSFVLLCLFLPVLVYYCPLLSVVSVLFGYISSVFIFFVLCLLLSLFFFILYSFFLYSFFFIFSFFSAAFLLTRAFVFKNWSRLFFENGPLLFAEGVVYSFFAFACPYFFKGGGIT